MTTRDDMVANIAVAMNQHRLVVDDAGKSVCTCGWWVSPLLDSVHRLHVANVLAAVSLGAVDDYRKRTHAVGLLLLDSGDITPMGTRMLDKIWEPAAANT